MSRVIEPYPHTLFPERDSRDHLDALTINNVQESESHVGEYGIPVFSVGSTQFSQGSKFSLQPACGWVTGGNIFIINDKQSSLTQEWVFILPSGFSKYELVIDFRIRDAFPSGEIGNTGNGGEFAGVLSVDIVPLANNSGGYVAGVGQTIFKAYRDKTSFDNINGGTVAKDDDSAADLSRFNGSNIHAFRIQDDLDSNLFLPNKARAMHFIFNIDYPDWTPTGTNATISSREHPITGQFISSDGLLSAILNIHR